LFDSSTSTGHADSVLSGNEALSRALGACRLRSSHGFVGVPLHRFVEGMTARPLVGLSHRPASSDLSAAGLALGGALLSGSGTCLLLRAGGVNVALEALATLGLMNELRAPVVIIAGSDAGPNSAATAQDDRGTLAHVCHLPQLDPGSPDELYHMTRLAAAASRAAGLPVVVRVSSRVLDVAGEVRESTPDPIDVAFALRYARAAGPYVLSSGTYRYHIDKRARRLQQLEALAGALSTRSGSDGPAGVVIAGHLGSRAHARVTARRVPALRLGMAWPLPRHAIESFLRDKREVLVLEEGEAFLERELQGVAQNAGLPCRVRGLDDRRPLRLDDERLEASLRRIGAAVDEVPPQERDVAAWQAVGEALTAITPLDLEPWALYSARMRNKLWGFSATDPRARLLGAIRELGRPSVVVADPSAAALLGFRDRLIDVKAGFGLAPAIAGAIAETSEVEEAEGPPLVVALLGDLNFFQSSLLGVIDNVGQKRDVLHIILVRDLGSVSTSGANSGPIVEAQLRALDLPYLSCRLGEDAAIESLRTIAAERGPRALVCLGAPGREEAIGG
jgi:TPP-dependent indolepyruvate ferredoxin oxidoreductase alpha subunit